MYLLCLRTFVQQLISSPFLWGLFRIKSSLRRIVPATSMAITSHFKAQFSFFNLLFNAWKTSAFGTPSSKILFLPKKLKLSFKRSKPLQQPPCPLKNPDLQKWKLSEKSKAHHTQNSYFLAWQTTTNKQQTTASNSRCSLKIKLYTMVTQFLYFFFF